MGRCGFRRDEETKEATTHILRLVIERRVKKGQQTLLVSVDMGNRWQCNIPITCRVTQTCSSTSPRSVRMPYNLILRLLWRIPLVSLCLFFLPMVSTTVAFPFVTTVTSVLCLVNLFRFLSLSRRYCDFCHCPFVSTTALCRLKRAVCTDRVFLSSGWRTCV